MRKQIMKIMAVAFAICGFVTMLSAQEIEIPFMDKKYKSDENFFRAVAYGKSPDMAMAKSLAMANGKKELAGYIETTIQSVLQSYTLQTELNNEMDFGRETSEELKSVVKQVLTNINTMAEKPIRSGNVIEYYVVVEVAKQKVVEKMETMLDKDGFELEKEKFEKVFDEEMRKYENGNE